MTEDIVEKKKGKFVIGESSPDDPIYKLGFVIAKRLVGKKVEVAPEEESSAAEEDQD